MYKNPRIIFENFISSASGIKDEFFKLKGSTAKGKKTHQSPIYCLRKISLKNFSYYSQLQLHAIKIKLVFDRQMPLMSRRYDGFFEIQFNQLSQPHCQSKLHKVRTKKDCILKTFYHELICEK